MHKSQKDSLTEQTQESSSATIQQVQKKQSPQKKNVSAIKQSREGELPPIQAKQQPIQRKTKAVYESPQGKKPPIQAKQRPIQHFQKPEETTNQETLKPNQTRLPDQLKSGIEHLSGMDISDVKVHYNSSKPAQLQAHAYAQGTNIHVASGQEKHLPHEAWHVVQQKQGRVKPTLQTKDGVNINDDVGLEREADVMGAKVLQTKRNHSLPLQQAKGSKKVTQLAGRGNRRRKKNNKKPQNTRSFQESKENAGITVIKGKTLNGYAEAKALETRHINATQRQEIKRIFEDSKICFNTIQYQYYRHDEQKATKTHYNFQIQVGGRKLNLRNRGVKSSLTTVLLNKLTLKKVQANPLLLQELKEKFLKAHKDSYADGKTRQID